MLALIMGLMLAIAHYFSDRIHIKSEKHREKIVSFIAGISITYIFLFLLPELYRGIYHLQKLLFLSLLVGFSVFHIVEKHIHSHRSRSVVQVEMKEAHSFAFFFYHLLIGVLLVELAQISPVDSMLFFFPVLFHTAISSAAMKDIHKSVMDIKGARIVLSLSTFLGVMIASFVYINPQVFHSVLGFVAGAILYITIRDSLPRDRRGSQLYFITGVAAYAAAIAITWL